MARSTKTNPSLLRDIEELRRLAREHDAPVWREVARRLERPRRNWSEVNLSRIARYAARGESVVVPGIVLASGALSDPVQVAGARVSASARRKIEAAGGKALGIVELARANPAGSGVRILG